MLKLEELPESKRTIRLGNCFMISDNLDDSDAIEVLSFSDKSIIRTETPFKIRFTMMLVCLSGSMRLRLQMEEFELSRGDVLVTVEGTIGECIGISSDARLFMMAFSNDFNILDSGIKPTAEILAGIMKRPCFRLKEKEMGHLKNMYDLMRECLGDENFLPKHELAVSCMRTIFCYVSTYLVRDETALRKPMTRNERILEDFLNLVEKYSLEHRDLDFYSGKLFISTKYLSKVVSAASGRSARSWICMRVILEAKVLLKEGDLSVQQISDRLNFANQSFFGTFFKRYAGMSPTDYRNM